MAVHITWYDTQSPVRADDGSLKPIIDRHFDELIPAVGAIDHMRGLIGFNKKTRNSMYDVLKAAKTEYVDVEYLPQMEDGTYSNFGISIEGRFGKETFDGRNKDVTVNKLVVGANRRIEYYGEQYDGRKVWGILTVPDDVEIKVIFPSEYDNS